jgi:molybdopterin-containing oxidoreductase family membrane subunit
MRRQLAPIVLALLTLMGAAALVGMALQGPEPRWRWGYVAGLASVLLSAAQMAPAVAFTSRLGRGLWGAPLRRVADTLALAGIVSAPVLILVNAQLPQWLGRSSIWSDWPFAPQLWDDIAIVGLTFTGAALVWFNTWPDRAPMRTQRQWRVLTSGLVTLGALYTMLAVFVQLLISSDLALSLVPGWHSAVFSAYQVVSAYQAGLALVIVLSSRNREAAEREETYHSCAKVLLALGMLWFYLVWCELLTNWYGRTPDEQSLLALFMFGPGAPLFLVATVCEFLVPVFVLIWNGPRKSASWTIGVAGVVVIGNLADRLRVYIAAWSVATQVPAEHLPDVLEPLPLPGWLPLLACIGIVAAASLSVWVVLSRVPAVGNWEMQAARRLTPRRSMLRTRVTVVGRPS